MAKSNLKMSLATVGVLQAIESGRRYGFDIMDATGLPSGTVYPILSRLTAAGHLAPRWERSQAARREKRPARKYYEITESGQAELRAARYRLETLTGIVPAGTVREVEG